MTYKAHFEKAYALMNQPIIEGNCGSLCDYHCCRPKGESGETLGMYLLPFEFEMMQAGHVTHVETHHKALYEMPPKIKKLYYMHCHEEEGCLRALRPIQCRTYPFEPHLQDDQFSLVIEKDQLHACPLLSDSSVWRSAFIEGIYEGWLILLEIPLIKYMVKMQSQERFEATNIFKQYSQDGWF